MIVKMTAQYDPRVTWKGRVVSASRWIAAEVLPGRENPDASEVPSGRVEPGSELIELERLGLWIRVETPDEKRFWVDGRRLQAAPARTGPPAEWVYVLDPVEVRGLDDTAAIVGTLQPGAWYLLEQVDGGWGHVTDADGTFEGWAPAAQIHRKTRSPSPEAAPLGVPVWEADHTVPAEGLRTWATPDPASDVVADLAVGVELQVVERRVDWARVRAENGWEAWVDGRRLTPIDPRR